MLKRVTKNSIASLYVVCAIIFMSCESVAQSDIKLSDDMQINIKSSPQAFWFKMGRKQRARWLKNHQT